MAPAKSEVTEVKKVPASVAPGTLEKDLAGVEDKGADDLSSDVDDGVDELGGDLNDEDDLSGMTDELDDDLTEDVSEELDTEKFFRDSDPGRDDDNGSIPQVW